MRHPLVIALLVPALAVTAVVPTMAPAAAAAPDVDLLLAERPFVTLWTEANVCPEAAAVNSLTGTALDRQLDQLARWFRHVNAQGSNRFVLGRDCMGTGWSTLASKLTARGLTVSNYRNGSYTSQSSRSADLNFHEAANLERNAPLAIGTFWPGDWAPSAGGDPTSPAARLVHPLDASDRVVRVRAVGTSRPDGTRGTWPFFRSRGTGLLPGAASQSTHDVVSWIRIDDELMQVIEAPTLVDGVVRLEVRRGIWGTGASDHASGTRVLSPVYIGSALRDAQHSGVPGRNDPDVPLRYALKVWMPEAHRWLIARITSTFGTGWQGHDGVWLDTTSCVQYSNSDPYGNEVFGWDDPEDAKLTPQRWGAAQRRKLTALRQAFPQKQMLANNLSSRNACARRLLSEVDGGGFEHWLKPSGQTFDWVASMRQLIDVQRRDLPALLWVRWNEGLSGSARRYRRFTYGSYLLVRRPLAARTMYGGPWGLTEPEDLYFWNWGGPRESADTLEDLRIPGTPLFRRRYGNGIVIVNPTSQDEVYPLGSTYYDVVHRTADGAPGAVTTVTVPALDAAFLLRPG